MTLDNIFVDTQGDIKKSVYVILVLILFYLTNHIFSFILKKTSSINIETKRRYVVNTNISLTIIFVFITLYIYSTELKNLAFSLAALMVAIVLITKELSLNIMGGIYKTFSGGFIIGDTIEIEGKRGSVIDRDLFTTTLLEVGPNKTSHNYTGRSIIVPNSIFLTNRVTNESFLKSFVLHTFKVILSPDCDWEKAEKILLERSEFYCSEYFEQAQVVLNKLFTKSHLETPILKPRVQINFTSKDEIELNVRITAPARTKGSVEQKILKDFLREFYK
ncbi:mechanosensitive ion channel family protein [Halobacteriovorax sp. HFRX-2_2]|uniref:mechanosensitive ion channel domain-containing protein n=1 Tax=unclassified Halobacteriovorax TaxID=2639665 RepID=UPI0037249EB4